MTRRIAGTFLALIGALLVLAVVPLGVSMAANQHASFRFDTDSAARDFAGAAEEHLSDHRSEEEMQDGLNTAAQRGDCAAVYLGDGSLLAQTPCTEASGPAARSLIASILRTEPSEDSEENPTAQDGRWLLIGVDIGDEGQRAGMVVYARDGDPVSDRVAAMWGWLAVTGLGCLALAALCSVRLARWITRPIDSLSVAAARLGEGDLAVRSTAEDGPEQVRSLSETFDLMAARIEGLVRSQRSWLADVSHQLRTPLTALRLRLDLLAAESPDEQQAAELAGAQEEIARLSRLVDGLLAVARAETEVPAKRPVRVDQVARERVAAWEPVADERGVSLTVQAPQPLAPALGPGDLEQMLDNLIANALDAAGEAEHPPGGGSGRVRVEAVREGGRVVVRVMDDGPGMTAEVKASAFHRYGHPEPRGNGLGLAIVHRLATANGGGADLLDTPGGGLTVRLDLGPAD